MDGLEQKLAASADREKKAEWAATVLMQVILPLRLMLSSGLVQMVKQAGELDGKICLLGQGSFADGWAKLRKRKALLQKREEIQRVIGGLEAEVQVSGQVLIKPRSVWSRNWPAIPPSRI